MRPLGEGGVLPEVARRPPSFKLTSCGDMGTIRRFLERPRKKGIAHGRPVGRRPSDAWRLLMDAAVFEVSCGHGADAPVEEITEPKSRG